MGKRIFIIVLCLSFVGITSFYQLANKDKVLSYEVDLNTQNLKFYWKTKKGNNISSLKNLKSYVTSHGEKLVFATNGGMYKKGRIPQGLYIEEGILKTPVDTVANGFGNFYLQPNGVFLISKENKPQIITTDSYVWNENIRFATQSGPMLLIDSIIHPRLTNGSKNLNIRNGVGVLPNGNLLFAMSTEKMNFYDFASFFKTKGCKNALYLDGFVSRTYLPSHNWEQLDGGFGVIIGVTE